jgi:hypothetical protein
MARRWNLERLVVEWTEGFARRKIGLTKSPN